MDFSKTKLQALYDYCTANKIEHLALVSEFYIWYNKCQILDGSFNPNVNTAWAEDLLYDTALDWVKALDLSCVCASCQSTWAQSIAQFLLDNTSNNLYKAVDPLLMQEFAWKKNSKKYGIELPENMQLDPSWEVPDWDFVGKATTSNDLKWSGGGSKPASKPEPARFDSGTDGVDFFRFDPKATTQKGRGIQWLWDNKSLLVDNDSKFKVNKHLFFPASYKHDNPDNYKFPLFVRPCPVTPRHGFVDSRIVRDLEALQGVVDETYSVERDAEIGLTRPIDAGTSAILTNGLLVVGTGNDGATSGKDGCLEFPVIGNNITDSEIPEDIIGKDEAPFWELVYDKDSSKFATPVPTVVQLRSGPAVNYQNGDFIPYDMEIKEVIDSDGGDLLAWEKRISDAAGTGIVIHTNTMACHYAIHGIVNNVPVITTFKPVVGQKLVKNADEAKKLDHATFRSAFFKAFTVNEMEGVDKSNVKGMLKNKLAFVLSVLHNSTALISAGQAEILGYAAGNFVKIVAALGRGESRHHENSSNWGLYGVDRNLVYTDSLNDFGPEEVGPELERLYGVFMDGTWDSAYGGPKWAEVVKGGIDVYNAAQISAEKCVAELNIAVHYQHNGGWFMNKFASQSMMDDASENPVRFAAQYGSVIYNYWQSIPSDSEVEDQENFPSNIDISGIVQKFVEAPEIEVSSSDVHEAYSHDVTHYLDDSVEDVGAKFQIRDIGAGEYRLQILTGGNNYEVIVHKDYLTAQAPKLIEKFVPKSNSWVPSSEAVYAPLKIRGKKSFWLCIGKKRVIAIDQLNKIWVAAAGHKLDVKAVA